MEQKFNFERLIMLLIVSSLIFIIVGTVMKGGQFDVAQLGNLDEKVPLIWKILMMGFAVIVGYGFIKKYYERGAWSKKDVVLLVLTVGILYFIWSQFISPEQIDLLTKTTASVMQSIGAFP